MRLALPIVLSNLLSRGVGIVDTVIVGRLGAEEVAAVGLGQIVVFFLLTLIFGIQTGTGVRVAHATGARDLPRCREAATRGVILALGVGVVSSCIGWWGSIGVVHLLGAPESTLRIADAYLRIVSIGIASKAVMLACVAIFHGRGESRYPLKIMLLVNLVHVGLSIPLVYGFNGFVVVASRGVEGAALALVIAETLGMLLMLGRLYSEQLLNWKPRLRKVGEDRKIVVLSVPVMLERLMVSTMQLVWAGTIVRSTVAAYAAHQIGFSIEGFSFLPGMAFATTATALVGQSLGAGDRAMAQRRAVEAHAIAFWFMSAMGASFFLFPTWWFGLFTTDAEVIQYGVIYCMITAFAQPLIATGQVLSGALRGASMTREVFFAHCVGAWGVRVPLSIYFGTVLMWHPGWVWATQLADWLVRDALLFWWSARAGVGLTRPRVSLSSSSYTLSNDEENY